MYTWNTPAFASSTPEQIKELAITSIVNRQLKEEAEEAAHFREEYSQGQPFEWDNKTPPLLPCARTPENLPPYLRPNTCEEQTPFLVHRCERRENEAKQYTGSAACPAKEAPRTCGRWS